MDGKVPSSALPNNQQPPHSYHICPNPHLTMIRLNQTGTGPPPFGPNLIPLVGLLSILLLFVVLELRGQVRVGRGLHASGDNRFSNPRSRYFGDMGMVADGHRNNFHPATTFLVERLALGGVIFGGEEGGKMCLPKPISDIWMACMSCYMLI